MIVTRRKAFAAALAVPSLADIPSAYAQSLEKRMPSNVTTGPRGPANRSLVALERSWIQSRFYLEAMMEEGKVPRDRWMKAKLNVIHGNFDIRDPDNGALLQKVVSGVRIPPAP
jgi:hypothetical protein